MLVLFVNTQARTHQHALALTLTPTDKMSRFREEFDLDEVDEALNGQDTRQHQRSARR